MSLDLYEIGANLILDDGIDTRLDGVIGKIKTLHDATDKINGQVDFANTAVLDLVIATAGIATSWSSFAEATERVADSARRAHATVPVAGGEALPREYGTLAGANADDYFRRSDSLIGGIFQGAIDGRFILLQNQAANIQFLAPLREGRPVLSADVLGAANVTESSQQDTSQDPLEYSAMNMSGKNSNAKNGAFTFQLAELADEIPNIGDDGAPRQSSGLTRLESYGSLRARNASEDSTGMDLSNSFAESSRGLDNTDDGEHAWKDYRSSQRNSSFGELDDRVLENAAARLLAMGMPGGTLNAAALAGIPIDENLGKTGIASDLATFERELASQIHDTSDRVSVLHISDGAGQELDETYSKNSAVLRNDLTSWDLFQHGLVRQRIAGEDKIPDALGLSATRSFDVGSRASVNAYDRSLQSSSLYNGVDLTSMVERQADELVLDIGRRFTQSIHGAGDDSSRAAAPVDETGSRISEGVSDSLGSLGWLVALTSAVLTELKSSTFHNQTETTGGQLEVRQTYYGPSGTRNDPLHVKVVEQFGPYQTHMPTGSTASLPSQSSPIPGQVQFSP